MPSNQFTVKFREVQVGKTFWGNDHYGGGWRYFKKLSSDTTTWQPNKMCSVSVNAEPVVRTHWMEPAQWFGGEEEVEILQDETLQTS